MMAACAFAPAKINLYLHVLGRRADGYHLIDSLIAFADIGDQLTARPAAALSLELSGPEAAGLAGLGLDNLALRAARLLADHAGISHGGISPGGISPGGIRSGAALHLHKNLPVASGIGGGSSDAAAALRALRRLWGSAIEEATVSRLSAQLGADVPVCLLARAAWVSGVGERVEPAPALPPAGILLANPRTPLPTAAVFAARRGPFGDAGRFAPMPQDAAGLAAVLQSRGNQLTEAAIGRVPQIGRVLEALSRLRGALLARMSGSGATCFALFADRAMAEAARAVLARAEPLWWCAAGALVAGHELCR